ncbi:hypothetical protein L9F63_022801 [Diploptera punctata]|uniref:Aftiphilin clathrin-binding box domain-containing protein n=1 Tax=Diploptera punctata TaxID=6984 RepID=A0AAD7ZMK7_DIPPU|nr:hypothetical protein L9F63_022801 [Diploptera punctata]
MSNIIPPMVSSSPPPMDDTMEEDEDDEFGDFATAEDTDAPSTPAMLPTLNNTFWREEHETKQNAMCNGNLVDEDEEEVDRKEVEITVVGQDNTSQDSVVSGTTDSGLCSASQNSEGASPSPVIGSSPSPVIPDREESSGSDETLVKSIDIDTRTYNETVTAESIPSSDNNDGGSEVSKHLYEELDEFGDFESVPTVHDDDFEDFESASFQDHCSVPADKNEGTKSANDEEMSNVSFDKLEQENGWFAHKLETVVTSLFPPSSTNLLDVDVSLLDKRLTALWVKLKDVEASHALSYQWAGSTANKCLLMALGIDSRNILFGARWNTSVPRFAANLGFSPLEPVRANRSPPAPVPVVPEQEGVVPAAQFDWNGSGLVNPLDCANSALLDLDYLNTLDNLTSSSSSPLSASNMAASGWRNSSSEYHLLHVCSSVYQQREEEEAALQDDITMVVKILRMEPMKIFSPLLGLKGVGCWLRMEVFPLKLTQESEQSSEGPSNVVQGILAGTTSEMSSSNELVQRILATNQSTPAPRSREGLSAEAVKVLDELPDLSFLQAKLLMFPVRGTSP